MGEATSRRIFNFAEFMVGDKQRAFGASFCAMDIPGLQSYGYLE